MPIFFFNQFSYPPEISTATTGRLRRSADHDVSGLDPGRYLRMDRADHVVTGRLDGEWDLGGDLFSHRVHDVVDRCAQSIQLSKGDPHGDVVNLLGNT